MSIIKKQGETIDFVAELKNPDGTLMSLAGCTAYCGYAHPGAPDADVIHPTPLFDYDNGLVKVSLEHADTQSMLGKYFFELKVMDTRSKVAVAIDETIDIKDSIIPEFTVTP